MRIVFRVVLLAALIALGFWLWTILFPSPEKLIRKRIAQVGRLASFSTGEGYVKQGLRIQSLANCFGPQVEVTIDLPGNQDHELAGRDKIIEYAGGARKSFQWLKVELLDPNVALAPDKESAVVNLTVKVTFPDQKDFFVQEMKFSLKRIDREWLIIRIGTVRTLSRARMGSWHGFFTAHRGHEPTLKPSQEGNCLRRSAVLLPTLEGLEVGRFMERSFSSAYA